MLLIFALVVLFGVSVYRQNRHNQDILVKNCELGNDLRKKERSLWDYILALPSDQPQTPEQEKRRADFKTFLAKTFPHRDCEGL